jgi:hypothetical protein
MQPARREMETWSVAQVAEHMAAFLQSPKYERIFRENLVDGELLLELDREDLMHLGIVKLRDVKSVLRWIAIVMTTMKTTATRTTRSSLCCCNRSLLFLTMSKLLLLWLQHSASLLLFILGLMTSRMRGFSKDG